MFIDSHIHLDDKIFDGNLSQHLAEARLLNIQKWVVPATTSQSFEKIIALSANHHGCYPALGLHPYFEHHEQDLKILEDYLIKHPSIVAIGECGIDLMIENANLDEQLKLFEAQVKLSITYQKPLIIHARKSLDIILKVLKKYPSIKGVIHSFSGSLQQLNHALNLDLYIGFGGTSTYPNAHNIQKLIKSIDINRLLIETDAPFQKGYFSEDSFHKPKDLAFIAKSVATIRHEPLSYLAEKTSKNAAQLFNLKE